MVLVDGEGLWVSVGVCAADIEESGVGEPFVDGVEELYGAEEVDGDGVVWVTVYVGDEGDGGEVEDVGDVSSVVEYGIDLVSLGNVAGAGVLVGGESTADDFPPLL